MLSLGGVYIGQADFVLLFIHQQNQRIVVNNLDDFALVDGLCWNLEGNQQQEKRQIAHVSIMATEASSRINGINCKESPPENGIA